jgi:hypothetical protein
MERRLRMTGSKRRDVLNMRLDEALAAFANPNPSRDLEKRIVAKIAQRKARCRKRIRVACLAFSAMLLGIAVLKPGNSLPTDAPHYEPIAVRAPEPVPSPAAPETVAVASVLSDSEPAAQDPEEEPLISDLEIEPLSIAALDLPALEHQ